MDISQKQVADNFLIAVHGGAGLAERSQISLEREKLYKESILESLRAGYNLLKNGRSSLDAVEAAIATMEDNPLFNAGRGSVLNEDGYAEMDASIMEGKMLKTGAVCSAKTVKNPISCCKKILEVSEHVMFSSDGVERFAEKNDVRIVDKTYFISDHRKALLETQKHSKVTSLDEVEIVKNQDKDTFNYKPVDFDPTKNKVGTVGAVAKDINGNLAAGTSSGGISNKKLGRVGDSSLIGSGTYANNSTCAVSMTGHGEFIIRAVAAYDLHCQIEYGKKNLKEACDNLINEKLNRQMGTKAGLVTVDSGQNVEMMFNTYGMIRGFVDRNGEATILLYDEERDITPIKYQI